MRKRVGRPVTAAQNCNYDSDLRLKVYRHRGGDGHTPGTANMNASCNTCFGFANFHPIKVHLTILYVSIRLPYRENNFFRKITSLCIINSLSKGSKYPIRNDAYEISVRSTKKKE